MDGRGADGLSAGAALAAFPANIELSALDGTNGFRLSGVAAIDSSGSAVSTAGDVNGDGVDDLLIGAYFADPNGINSGASYVVFGGAGVGMAATSSSRPSIARTASGSRASRPVTPRAPR